MFPNLGPMELILIMGLGVLLFGKRLPEVGRSLGRGIVEFKKGLNGVGDDFDASSSSRSGSSYGGSSRYSDERPGGDSAYADTAVPKFEVPGTASGSPATPASPTADSASVPQMEYPASTPRD
jgi:sec-independent protein translocase protein TatA